MWICCQLGAREHYSVPRAIDTQGQLGLLVTDVWARGAAQAGLFSARAKDRFHPDLQRADVRACNLRYVGFELCLRYRRKGWERIMARNDWFQSRALSAIRAYRDSHPNQSVVLFAYSYAARALFEFAKESGWSTVLGQVDPGPFEEKLVMDLPDASHSTALPAPQAYWNQWRSECALADRIIVNSEWSRHALQSEGMDPNKLDVVPLGYNPPAEAANFIRRYPPAFNAARPLRILFLGQVNIRKGVAAILDAVPQFENLPVEFWMVGDVQIPVRPEYRQHPRIRWVGSIPRAATARFYRDADVFLFPTFSDGFGLTQLEAQSWKLPVIASKNCGSVVRHLENGYLLPTVSSSHIVAAIKWILDDPGRLRMMSRNSGVTDSFSLQNLARSLVTLHSKAA